MIWYKILTFTISVSCSLLWLDSKGWWLGKWEDDGQYQSILNKPPTSLSHPPATPLQLLICFICLMWTILILSDSLSVPSQTKWFNLILNQVNLNLTYVDAPLVIFQSELVFCVLVCWTSTFFVTSVVLRTHLMSCRSAARSVIPSSLLSLVLLNIFLLPQELNYTPLNFNASQNWSIAGVGPSRGNF